MTTSESWYSRRTVKVGSPEPVYLSAFPGLTTTITCFFAQVHMLASDLYDELTVSLHRVRTGGQDAWEWTDRGEVPGWGDTSWADPGADAEESESDIYSYYPSRPSTKL